MADDEVRDEKPERPVLTGLLALVGVGLAVGLVLGAVALVATQVLGLGDESDGSSGRATSAQSMYLPKPEKTDAPDEPLVTLAVDPRASESTEPSDPTTSATPETELTLSAGQTSVAPMQQIDLTGVYPGGEGAVLQVQRFTNGEWLDFPVTASVSNETFTTYIITGQLGENRFRVIDNSTGLESNEVTVSIG